MLEANHIKHLEESMQRLTEYCKQLERDQLRLRQEILQKYGPQVLERVKSEELRAFGSVSKNYPYIFHHLKYSSHEIVDNNIKYALARILAQGLGVERNEAQAIQHYEEILNKPEGDKVYALRSLVVRYAFGLGVAPDIEKAKKLLTGNSGDRCKCIGYYEPLEELLEHAHESAYQKFIRFIRNNYKLDSLPQIIAKVIKEKSLKITKENYLVFHAIKVLARTENWQNINDWLDVYRHIRLSYYGFDPVKVMADTWRLGPFYNKVAKNGLPVLGTLQDEHFGTPGMYDGEPIEPSVVAFTGLTATSQGHLDFHYRESVMEPALLLKETWIPRSFLHSDTTSFSGLVLI